MARNREAAPGPETQLKQVEAFIGSIVDRISQDQWQDVHLEVRAGAAHVELRLRRGHPESEASRTELLFAAAVGELRLGERVPNVAEADAVGALRKRIRRADPEFATLVSNSNPAIVFKDEEGTGADRMMSGALKAGLDRLATRVAQEWPGVKLRVTDAWDEEGEHSPNSLHYEGRAADLTTHPPDGAKLGRLGRLAVDAGLDWVFFEDSSHIHVSVSS